MDSTNPKVSFIPKGSLVREESFLERRRPRSVLGFLAISAFILSVGAYAILFYFNDKLNSTVAEKTTEIQNAQNEFSDAPEVGQAKVFRARADLALQLLNAHTVVSPVFTFLSKNTVDSILYDKFAFKNDSTGATLTLAGEAPTYAALAYQADILRNQIRELSGFSIENITLTKFSTITFVLTLAFNPDYLSYTKNLNSTESSTAGQVVPQLNASVPLASPASITFAPAPTSTSVVPTKNSVVLPPPLPLPPSTPVASTKTSVVFPSPLPLPPSTSSNKNSLILPVAPTSTLPLAVVGSSTFTASTSSPLLLVSSSTLLVSTSSPSLSEGTSSQQIATTTSVPPVAPPQSFWSVLWAHWLAFWAKFKFW